MAYRWQWLIGYEDAWKFSGEVASNAIDSRKRIPHLQRAGIRENWIKLLPITTGNTSIDQEFSRTPWSNHFNSITTKWIIAAHFTVFFHPTSRNTMTSCSSFPHDGLTSYPGQWLMTDLCGIWNQTSCLLLFSAASISVAVAQTTLFALKHLLEKPLYNGNIVWLYFLI